MKKVIALLSSIAALTVVVVANAGAERAEVPQTSVPSAGVELEWGTGTQPRYVPSRSGATFATPYRGRGPLFELRWGDGGPPELVRLDAK